MKKNMFLTIGSILMLLFSVLLIDVSFETAQAATEITGIINSNITLTKAESPIVFAGPVVVNANATLTIQAGASIDLNGNHLKVDGTLIAKGSVDNWIYFIGGTINFTSTSTTDCIIENAILKWILVSIRSSVKIKSTYILGAQDKNVIDIYAGSPMISNNTLTGGVDSVAIVKISGGSPTITNNNIIAHVDNGLYPNPPIEMNRFGTEYGVYAENVNGAYITYNLFILAFRGTSIKVVSGSATVEGNSELLYNPITTQPPTPTPTPSALPTPTLPPYPPSSHSPSPSQTPSPSPTQPQAEANGIVIAVIIASVIINVLLVFLVALLLRKRR